MLSSYSTGVFSWVLLLFLVVSASSMAFLKNLVVNTVVMCAFSLTMAVLHLVMEAPDVAITEASVGAGLSTVVMLAALARMGYKRGIIEDECTKGKLLVALLVAVFMVVGLMYVVVDLPEFGDGHAPVHVNATPYYVSGASAYMGIPNVVTAVLASFRGYDTLCETVVVFAASVCVSLLLSGERG